LAVIASEVASHRGYRIGSGTGKKME